MPRTTEESKSDAPLTDAQLEEVRQAKINRAVFENPTTTPTKHRCPHCTTELVPHNDSLGALHCDNCDAGCCFTIEGKALVLRPGSRGCLKAVR